MIGDSNAALAFFDTLPGVDPQRIVMVGTSIGADAEVGASAVSLCLRGAICACPITRRCRQQSGFNGRLYYKQGNPHDKDY